MRIMASQNGPIYESGQPQQPAVPLTAQPSTVPLLHSKSAIRLHTWGQLAARELLVESARHKFFTIPDFRGSARAAFRLMRTDQFRNAHKIYVDTQPCSRLLQQIVTFSGKDLFVPPPPDSTMAGQLFRAVRAQQLPEILRSLEDTSGDGGPDCTPARDAVESAFDMVAPYFVDCDPLAMDELDLVLVGCVAVSPSNGQCIGRGFGTTDLRLAVLQHIGAITARTCIATVVHEEQLLNAHQHQHHAQQRRLFGPHDFPVDLVVTPFFHHAIYGRAERPDRIDWRRISRRRLACWPLLEHLHDALVRQGQRVETKDDDSDVESTRIQRNPGLAKYHKNRGTVDRLTGAELQAYNLVIFGRHPPLDVVAPAPAASKAATPVHQTAPQAMATVVAPGGPRPTMGDNSVGLLGQIQLNMMGQHPSAAPIATVEPVRHAAPPPAPPAPPLMAPTAQLVAGDKEQYRWTIAQRFQPHIVGGRASAAHQQQHRGASGDRVPTMNAAALDAATRRLLDTNEFRLAEHLLVFNQPNVEPIAMQTLRSGKQLYVPLMPPTTTTTPLPADGPQAASPFARIDPDRPSSAASAAVPMPLSDAMRELDMIVVAAVCAGRNGRIIGNGSGAIDMHFGVLVECGAVSHWTKIVCVLDDAQLFDELPERAFRSHDMPVDMIVTPTQLVHVHRPPKRPPGICWRLLSAERVRSSALLAALMHRRSAKAPADAMGAVPMPTPSALVGNPMLADVQLQQPPPPFGSLVGPRAPLAPVYSAMSMPQVFATDDEALGRMRRLRQFENCISFTFSELPAQMTRQMLGQLIEMQLQTKVHYIKHSKRKCRAYVYFHAVAPDCVRDLYERCKRLTMFNERNEPTPFRVVCNQFDPIGASLGHSNASGLLPQLPMAQPQFGWTNHQPNMAQHNRPQSWFNVPQPHQTPGAYFQQAQQQQQQQQHGHFGQPNNGGTMLSHQAKPYVPRSRANDYNCVTGTALAQANGGAGRPNGMMPMLMWNQ